MRLPGSKTSNAENTTFVGQSTGGSLQTGGNLLEISMDSAPFAVTCALDYFVILGQKGSLVPDYIVPQTFEQYAKGGGPGDSVPLRQSALTQKQQAENFRLLFYFSSSRITFCGARRMP